MENETTPLEALMTLAKRPCYIHGKLDQLRRRLGREVTLGDALMYKTPYRKAYYIQTLAALIKRSTEEGKPVSRPVEYLIDFAKKVVEHYGEKDLNVLIPKFKTDYSRAIAEMKTSLIDSDQTASKAWDDLFV